MHLILDFKEWLIMGRKSKYVYMKQLKAMQVGIQVIIMIIMTDTFTKLKNILRAFRGFIIVL